MSPIKSPSGGQPITRPGHRSLPEYNRQELDGTLVAHTHNATRTVVVTVSPVTTTLEYKDHSGLNQSMNVVTSVTVTTDTVVDETGGIA